MALTTDNLDQSVSSELPGNPSLWISRRDATPTVYDLYINDAKVVAGNILATSTSDDKQVNRSHRHPQHPQFRWLSLIDNRPFFYPRPRWIHIDIWLLEKAIVRHWEDWQMPAELATWVWLKKKCELGTYSIITFRYWIVLHHGCHNTLWSLQYAVLLIFFQRSIHFFSGSAHNRQSAGAHCTVGDGTFAVSIQSRCRQVYRTIR